jgi:hypothetical protein
VLRLTLVVSALKPMAGLPHPRLWVEVGGRDLDYREITATQDRPERLVYLVQLDDLAIQTKGVSIQLSNKVEVPYAVPGFENEDKTNPKDPVPGGTGLFRPAFDRRGLPPEKQPAPHIVLQGNKGKTVKELLRQHQEDARCAVCHKNIDPVGFAFQNFDLSGRWRNVEHESYARAELDGRIAWRGVGATRPVDAAGRFPRGEEFRSFAQFKEILVRDYQADLVRGLMNNLTLYATGRQPDVDDRKVIAALLHDSAPKGYPLRDLLKALVRSRVFLER